MVPALHRWHTRDAQVRRPRLVLVASRLRSLVTDRTARAPFLSDAGSAREIDRPALAVAAAAWSCALDDLAVPPGGRVLLDIADPLAFAVVHLSVIAAGRCSAPVDPVAPDPELARARRTLAPLVALTDRADRPGVQVDPATGRPSNSDDVGAGPDRGPGSVVLLTSGSTGTPKAVELAEPQLLHVAGAVAAHHRLTPADRGYCPLPLFHVNALVVGLLATLLAGGELVLHRRFHRTGFWSLLRDRDVTWVNAAPAIVTILARDEVEPVVGPRLRFVRSASAPLAPAVRALFEARTGLTVVESYGMTEAASQITATPLDQPHRPGSVGRPVDVGLRVVDGRVWIRGAGVIRFYAGGAAADRFTADGWLDTGDLGRLDEDGWLYRRRRTDAPLAAAHAPHRKTE